MPEYSNYVEGRTNADALDGSELVAISQDGAARKTTTQDIADLAPAAGIQTIVPGTNVTVDDTDPLNPIVSASGGGGSGTVESVTGDGVDNTDPDNPVLTFPIASEVVFTPSGNISSTDVQAAIEELDTDLGSKVDKETFATLTFASPTVWDNNNRQSPLAKVTATGDFTIDMTNVKSGAQGVLKVTSNTASAFTLTFDTDFTNIEATTGDSLLTYTFTANNGAVYILSFVVDGTTISWVILDVEAANITPFVWATLGSAQSISNNDSTVMVSFTAESEDNSSMWASSPNPTRFVIPGSGDKLAIVTVRSQWASNATGVRRNIPFVNGVTTNDIGQQGALSGVASIITSTHQIPCSGGDYIEILAYQNSGGSLNLDACHCRISVHNI